MKKTVLAGLMIVVVVAALGSANVVFAQGPNPGPEVPGTGVGVGGRGTGLRQSADPVGRMGNPDVEGLGLLEEGQIAYAVQELDLSAEEIEARLNAGETLAEIAVSEGVEDYYTFVEAARNYAREQLLAEGLDIPGWYGGKGADGQGTGANGQGTGQGTNGQAESPRYNMEDCDEPLNLNSDGSPVQAGGGRGRWNQ